MYGLNAIRLAAAITAFTEPGALDGAIATPFLMRALVGRRRAIAATIRRSLRARPTETSPVGWKCLETWKAITFFRVAQPKCPVTVVLKPAVVKSPWSSR